MNQPNIFTFATSELSQDAFLCWLLSWSNPVYKKHDSMLHDSAIRFLKLIFQKHGHIMPEIKKVSVLKQVHRVDVLCIINDKFTIIIEDKTHTAQHSGQLERYLTEIRKHYTSILLPIYYKTEEQFCFEEVEKYGYEVISRNEMLSVIGCYAGDNDIMTSYIHHIKRISLQYGSFAIENINDWTQRAWIGFHQKLKIALNDGRWSYVPNQTGGFRCFWWRVQHNENGSQYLQLENEKLCFKIEVKEKSNRRQMRQKWYDAFRLASTQYDFDFKKPERFGYGKCMTVGILNRDFRIQNEGVLDFERTAEILKRAEQVFDDAISNSNRPK